MNQNEPNLARNASTAVLVPIAGLVLGLAVGGLRARVVGPNEFAQIACVIRWAVTGFFGGSALLVLQAASSRRHQISMRGLMILVILAGVLAWFFGRVLFAAIGYEGF